MISERVLLKLLTNLDEARHSIHVNGIFPEIITEEWFTENVSGKLTYKDFQAFYQQAIEQCQKDEYQYLRKDEYPPIEDQLDMIYWDKVNGTNNWETLIQSIKEKYPKT